MMDYLNIYHNIHDLLFHYCKNIFCNMLLNLEMLNIEVDHINLFHYMENLKDLYILIDVIFFHFHFDYFSFYFSLF